MSYTPYDWFWLRADGLSVYSTRYNEEMSVEDPRYQAWLERGAVPTGYPVDENGEESRAELAAVLRDASKDGPYPLRVYPLSLEEIQDDFTAAVQAHLDGFAKTRNYDGILSAASYATSKNPKFAMEGQYTVEARDAVWAKGYEIMGAVLAGERPLPTLEEVLAELPALAWPEDA